MSILYCCFCNEYVDTDYHSEHYNSNGECWEKIIEAYKEIDNYEAETVNDKAMFINKACQDYGISKADLIGYEKEVGIKGGII